MKNPKNWTVQDMGREYAEIVSGMVYSCRICKKKNKYDPRGFCSEEHRKEFYKNEQSTSLK